MKNLLRVGLLFLAILAHAQNGAIMPPILPPFFQVDGKTPVALGFVCTTASGTNTPLATYQNAGLSTPNQNPIRLNIDGRAVNGSTPVPVYLQASRYRISVYAAGTGNTCGVTSVGTLLFQQDGVYDYGQLFGSTGGISGSGTINKFPIWTGTTALGNSNSGQSANLGSGIGPGTYINSKLLVGGTTADWTGSQFNVVGGVVLSNNASNAQTLSFTTTGGTNGYNLIAGNHSGTGHDTAIEFNTHPTGPPTVQIGADTNSQIYVTNPAFLNNHGGFFGEPSAVGCCNQFVVSMENSDSDATKAHSALQGFSDNQVAGDNSIVSAGVGGFVYADSPHAYNGVLNGTTGICYAILQPANAAITVNECTGVYGRTTYYSAGTINFAESVKADMGSIIGTPLTVNHWYGFQAVPIVAVAGGSSVAIQSLLHLEDISAGLATTNWALASEGGNSYHVGNFFVGSVSSTLPDATAGPHFTVANTASTQAGEITVGNNQNNTSSVVGALQFANYNTGAAEKRIAVIQANTNGATNTGELEFKIANAGVFTATPMTLDGLGFLSVLGKIHPGTLTVASLGSAATWEGSMILVNDSTVVSAEGQVCVGGNSHVALAFSDGVNWKCF